MKSISCGNRDGCRTAEDISACTDAWATSPLVAGGPRPKSKHKSSSRDVIRALVRLSASCMSPGQWETSISFLCCISRMNAALTRRCRVRCPPSRSTLPRYCLQGDACCMRHPPTRRATPRATATEQRPHNLKPAPTQLYWVSPSFGASISRPRGTHRITGLYYLLSGRQKARNSRPCRSAFRPLSQAAIVDTTLYSLKTPVLCCRSSAPGEETVRLSLSNVNSRELC